MTKTEDERFEAFANHVRNAMGEALAAFMRYSNLVHREAIEEADRLRKRNAYLEARVAELEGRRAA